MVTSPAQDGVLFAVPDIGALLLIVLLENARQRQLTFSSLLKKRKHSISGHFPEFTRSHGSGIFSNNSENSGNMVFQTYTTSQRLDHFVLLDRQHPSTNALCDLPCFLHHWCGEVEPQTAGNDKAFFRLDDTSERATPFNTHSISAQAAVDYPQRLAPKWLRASPSFYLLVPSTSPKMSRCALVCFPQCSSWRRYSSRRGSPTECSCVVVERLCHFVFLFSFSFVVTSFARSHCPAQLPTLVDVRGRGEGPCPPLKAVLRSCQTSCLGLRREDLGLATSIARAFTLPCGQLEVSPS